MASNMVYSIQLQLRVDDSQLDATIAKLGTLKKAAKDIHVKTAGGGYRRLNTYPPRSYTPPVIPRRQYSLPDRLDVGGRWHLRQFGQWRFSQAGWQNGLGVFQKRVKTFQDSFFNNVSSFSGLRYNMVNLGKVFTSLTGVVGKAIPALGAFGQVAIGAAKIWMGVHAWRLASSGLPLLVGTKLLNSNNMAEAASNLMQMRMAEKGLGGNYQATLNRATQLAAEYGFSRVGMLNAMNMFTGLNVDGKKLTPEEASHLAEVVGKIAHVGGLSFERVNVNLQQLLGQAVPSIRDIRELVGQAPFIGKLAMNMMEERGVQGDYRDWLKNKSNLRSVLDEFNELVESHPVMKARGQIALAKENFWMRIADGLSPYWDKIAQANEKLYSWLGDKIVSWVSNIDVDAVDSFIKELDKFANAIGYIAKGIGATVDFINSSLDKLPLRNIGNGSKLLPEIPNYIPASSPSGTYTTEYNWLNKPKTKKTLDPQKEVANLYNKAKAEWEIDRYDSVRVRKLIEKTFPSMSKDSIAKNTATALANIWTGRDSLLMQMPSNRIPIKNYFGPEENSTVPETIGWVLDFEKIRNNFKKIITPKRDIDSIFGGAADADAEKIKNLSKGSKAIFINFNKEIVNMSVNIASVENIEELGRKLEPKIEEVVVRGLTIALNNATSVT